MMWFLFASCQDDVTQIPVECDDRITYATVAEPYLRNYCTVVTQQTFQREVDLVHQNLSIWIHTQMQDNGLFVPMFDQYIFKRCHHREGFQM